VQQARQVQKVRVTVVAALLGDAVDISTTLEHQPPASV